MKGAMMAEARIDRQWRPVDDLRTPPELFAALDKEFGFTLDACATPENALCERYFTPEQNGLAYPWSRDVVWVNPPYSDIGPCVKKAAEEAHWGATVVILLPVRSDLGWWHDYVIPCGEIRFIRFIRSRLRFNGMRTNAPFPSCIVVFRPEEAS